MHIEKEQRRKGEKEHSPLPLFSFSPFPGHMTPLHYYLLLSALLFSIGLAGALTRRNAILVLIGIELMLNAANLNFIAFWRYSPNPEALHGVMFVIFSIAVAAAEAAVGLALIISIYRHYKTTNLDQMDSMKG
jgi:NADH-quinone oxidoreductase subunit K